MPKACYFRQQADMCARLALATRDEEIAERFALMAHTYLAKAAAAERAQGTILMSEGPPPAPDGSPPDSE